MTKTAAVNHEITLESGFHISQIAKEFNVTINSCWAWHDCVQKALLFEFWRASIGTCEGNSQSTNSHRYCWYFIGNNKSNPLFNSWSNRFCSSKSICFVYAFKMSLLFENFKLFESLVLCAGYVGKFDQRITMKHFDNVQ